MRHDASMSCFPKFCVLCICIVSLFARANQESPAYFNTQSYSHKEEIIENGFYPTMRLSDFLAGYSANMDADVSDARYVNIQIDATKWEAMMTHYYSGQRFTGKEFYPVTAYFTHAGQSEIIT
jgi:hypothetical protein